MNSLMHISYYTIIKCLLHDAQKSYIWVIRYINTHSRCILYMHIFCMYILDTNINCVYGKHL